MKELTDLEKNEIQATFFIVKNKNMELFFRKRESAEKFLSSQTATSGMRLVITRFIDA